MVPKIVTITDLSVHSADEITAVATALNTRPRDLGYSNRVRDTRMENAGRGT